MIPVYLGGRTEATDALRVMTFAVSRLTTVDARWRSGPLAAVNVVAIDATATQFIFLPAKNEENELPPNFQ
jgi:hypothetical protein